MNKFYVLDSGAIFQWHKLQGTLPITEIEFYTTDNVLMEIRDSQSRELLANLPTTIHIRNPSHDTIQLIKKYANCTGDYGVLSHTDLGVIALTYELELEKNGKKNIKELPEEQQQQPKKIASTNVYRKVQLTPFYEVFGKKKEDEEKQKALDELFLIHDEEDSEEEEEEEEEEEIEEKEQVESIQQESLEEHEEKVEESKPKGRRHRHNHSLNTKLTHLLSDDDHEKEETKQEEEEVSSSHWKTIPSKKQTKTVVEKTTNGFGFESMGWITPKNISIKKQLANQVELDIIEKQVKQDSPTTIKNTSNNNSILVGCISTDFSLQNVLLFMNLMIINVEGYRIRNLIKWVKRCTACSCLEMNTSKEFCPLCGNHTLRRVSLYIDGDGKEFFLYNPKRHKQNLRGTIYPLPLPRGGRLNEDPILSEDMTLSFRKIKIRKGTKTVHDANESIQKVFDVDYQFDKRTVNDNGNNRMSAITAFMNHNIYGQNAISYYNGYRNKKNPNEVKHVATKKKKRAPLTH